MAAGIGAGMSAMSPLAALWQKIQGLRGMAGPAAAAAGPAADPMMAAGTGMGGAPGAGFSLNNGPAAGDFGSNLSMPMDPSQYSLAGKAMGGGAPTSDFGSQVNPAIAPSTKMAGGLSPMTKPSPDQLARAMKLQQYALASKGLQDLRSQMGGDEGGKGPTARPFYAPGGKASGLPNTPVGGTRAPTQPVTSAGTFLLSPAGRDAMNRLQAIVQQGSMSGA